jgi:hypothetical protein
MNRVSCWRTFLLLLATGCATTPTRHPLTELEVPLVLTPGEQEMEKCLPDGLRLVTAFRNEFQGEVTNVQRKLRELGARCNDGKLLDRNGRELYFYWVPDSGVQRSEDQIKIWADAEHRRLEELEHRFRVIYMYHVVRPC